MINVFDAYELMKVKMVLDFLLFTSYHLMCILVRYYFDQRLKEAFTTAPADPTVDLNMQL